MPVKLVHRDNGTTIYCSRASVELHAAAGYYPPGEALVDIEIPAKSARKDAWVTYAAAQGIENPKQYTRDELIALLTDDVAVDEPKQTAGVANEHAEPEHGDLDAEA